MKKLLNKSIIIPILLILAAVLGPIELAGVSPPIDVDDGTLIDWVDAPLQLVDDIDEPTLSMTDLTFVAFDFDGTWLYVRWDVFNDSTNPEVLYDMGINFTGNLTGTDDDWDIFVSAQVERIGGIPVLTNISIRIKGSPQDIHLWNASDDGNMTEDGSLYLDPAPGAPLGNHSVEARFPLSILGITSGVVFGSFRSHPSGSVNSNVKDTVPNSGYLIITIDNNPPQLSNLQDTPDPQENGGSVNITVDATDDFGLDTVWVNITHPDTTWTNVTMLNGTLDEWYLENTYNDLGIYTYSVWANDTYDNWVTIGPGTFTIQDTDGPIIDNLQDSPDPQEYEGNVNISCDVTDDFAVDSVVIEILFPNGSSINISMIKGPGDGWFYDTQYYDLDVHTYTVWAKDIYDNWNSAGPETFIIQDTEPPTIQDPVALPDPQEMGEDVNITVVVTDDIGVDDVWILITYPNGTIVNVTMEPGDDDDWYINLPYDDLGAYEYIVYANDTSGNINTTTFQSFNIQDTERPDIGIPDVTPNPQEEDEDVNITVTITDNDEVDEVWINITFPDGTWINETMTSTDGENWTYNNNFTNSGNYTYSIGALDNSGNPKKSDFETFSIQPKQVPDPDPDPDPDPSPPPVGIPKKLYLVTLLIFWPLLLIIFTIALEHRYGFGNRFKRDIKPIASALLEKPYGGPNNPGILNELFLLSQRTGIPLEECIVATLVSDIPSQTQDQVINHVLENINEIKKVQR